MANRLTILGAAANAVLSDGRVAIPGLSVGEVEGGPHLYGGSPRLGEVRAINPDGTVVVKWDGGALQSFQPTALEAYRQPKGSVAQDAARATERHRANAVRYAVGGTLIAGVLGTVAYFIFRKRPPPAPPV